MPQSQQKIHLSDIVILISQMTLYWLMDMGLVIGPIFEINPIHKSIGPSWWTWVFLVGPILGSSPFHQMWMTMSPQVKRLYAPLWPRLWLLTISEYSCNHKSNVICSIHPSHEYPHVYYNISYQVAWDSLPPTISIIY